MRNLYNMPEPLQQLRNYVTPGQLPKGISNSPLWKYAPTAVHSAAVDDFFTHATIADYSQNASIVAADTWATVVDTTGSGELYYVVSPAFGTTSTSATLHVSIAVDGIETLIEVPSEGTGVAQTVNSRLVIGSAGIGYPSVSDTSAANPFAPSNNMEGFVRKVRGHYQADYFTLFNPYWFKIHNLPMVRFESSLKVMVKCSNYSATANHRRALVMFEKD